MTLVKSLRFFLPCLAVLLLAGMRAGGAEATPRYEPKWEGKRGLFGGGSMPEVAARSKAAGNFKDAARLYQRMYEAAEFDENRASSLLEQANCLYLARKDHSAFTCYQKVLEAYPNLVPIESSLGNLRELARRFATGEASFFHFKDHESAIKTYELILRIAPAGRNAPADMSRMAELQTANNLPEEAVDSYHELCKRFPRSDEAAAARVSVARLLLKMGRRGDGDGRHIRQARNELQYYIREYPKHEQAADGQLLLSLVRENQATRLFDMGKFYLRKLSYRPEAARRYLHDVVREYPDTAAAVKAALLLAQVEKTAVVMPTMPAGTAPGAVIGVPGGGSVRPEPPPEPPARYLKQQEGVEKWLLPLEDLNLHKEGK